VISQRIIWQAKSQLNASVCKYFSPYFQVIIFHIS